MALANATAPFDAGEELAFRRSVADVLDTRASLVTGVEASYEDARRRLRGAAGRVIAAFDVEVDTHTDSVDDVRDAFVSILSTRAPRHGL